MGMRWPVHFVSITFHRLGLVSVNILVREVELQRLGTWKESKKRHYDFSLGVYFDVVTVRGEQ